MVILCHLVIIFLLCCFCNLIGIITADDMTSIDGDSFTTPVIINNSDVDGSPTPVTSDNVDEATTAGITVDNIDTTTSDNDGVQNLTTANTITTDNTTFNDIEDEFGSGATEPPDGTYWRYAEQLNLYLPFQLGPGGKLVDLERMTNCVCPRVYYPVCSQNHRTFLNECLLNCLKAKMGRKGPCIIYRRSGNSSKHFHSDYIYAPKDWAKVTIDAPEFIVNNVTFYNISADYFDKH